jgi:BclA C-terminal domain/Collagen triple helix repeat (20 copies)
MSGGALAAQHYLLTSTKQISPKVLKQLKGDKGARGVRGPEGLRGAQGHQGIQGTTGSVGATGVTGPPGALLSAFGYVFNQAAEVVAIEAPITFDSNGPLLGVTHAPGNAGLVVTNSGTYKVTFSVSAVEPAQFALFVNGAAAAGTVYGSGTGTQQDTGQAILTLAAGDTLTLVNHTSAAAVTLQTIAGGSQTNVNASVVIERLS